MKERVSMLAALAPITEGVYDLGISYESTSRGKERNYRHTHKGFIQKYTCQQPAPISSVTVQVDSDSINQSDRNTDNTVTVIWQPTAASNIDRFHMTVRPVDQWLYPTLVDCPNPFVGSYPPSHPGHLPSLHNPAARANAPQGCNTTWR